MSIEPPADACRRLPVRNGETSTVLRAASGALLALCACHPNSDATARARAPSAIAQSGPPPSPPTAVSPAVSPGVSPGVPAVVTAAGAQPAAAAPVSGARSEGDDEFLVVTPSNDLVLRTRERVLQVLDKSVQNAIYDPKLELVWVEGESLRVLDLRQPGAQAIPIVRKWPGTEQLTIEHPASTVTRNDNCDVGSMATLEWNERPTLKVTAEQDGTLPLVSKAWLKQQLTRTPRPLPAPLRIAEAQRHIDLPPRLAHCQGSESCGNAVRFGAYDLELVLAVTLEGDCEHPYCVFHDPNSGAFSSPIVGDRWQGAGDRAGPCGLYFFDRGGKTFLEAGRICDASGRCQDVGGYVLGWRHPGVVVGAESDGSMAPDAAELEKLEREREQEGDAAEGEGE